MLAALLSLGAVMANLLEIIDTHSMYKSRRKRMPFDSVSKMGPTSWPHLSELAPWFNHKLALPGKPLIFNFFIRGVVSQKSNSVVRSTTKLGQRPSVSKPSKRSEVKWKSTRAFT